MRKRSEGKGDEQERLIRAMRGLKGRAREVLDRIAVGDDSYVHSVTARGLIKKGLIEGYQQIDRQGALSFSINRYRMPIHVHAAWCALCAREVEEEENAEN